MTDDERLQMTKELEQWRKQACDSQATIDRLTRERDEARAENHRLGSLVADARRFIDPDQHAAWEESAAGWQCDCERERDEARKSRIKLIDKIRVFYDSWYDPVEHRAAIEALERKRDEAQAKIELLATLLREIHECGDEKYAQSNLSKRVATVLDRLDARRCLGHD